MFCTKKTEKTPSLSGSFEKISIIKSGIQKFKKRFFPVLSHKISKQACSKKGEFTLPLDDPYPYFWLHPSDWMSLYIPHASCENYRFKFFLNSGVWYKIRQDVQFKQGYAFKNWVEGLSDEAYYPWESPKKIDLNWSTLHLPPNKRKFQFIHKR